MDHFLEETVHPPEGGLTQPKYCIETKELSLFYGAKAVLKGICLQIPRSQVTAIIGPSGCGKTSFLTVLNRLTDLIPTARVVGKVCIDGEDIHAPRTDVIRLRRSVGMIFQKPVPFPFSIKKNMVFALKEHGIKGRDRQAQYVETALKDVGLWGEVKDRLFQPANVLSGGQQQRLCIARALALKPDVLLMDEPCSALDPVSSAAVESLIQRLKRDYTIVIVTHNLAQAKRISDKTVFFWPAEGVGTLIESEDTETFFKNPRHPLTEAYVRDFTG